MIDNDIGIDLPQEKYSAENHTDGWNRYPIFRYHAQLAMIESRIYSEIYSIQAQSRSTSERLRSVCQLDKALTEWKAALPIEIRPENAIYCAQEQFLPVATLHYAYFNCLMTVHRAPIYHGTGTSRHLSQSASTLRDQSLNPQIYTSQSVCLAAARNSIKLLHSLPNGVVWLVSAFHAH